MKKAIASSTVNSIVTDLLHLYKTTKFKLQHYPIYHKVVSSDYLQNSHFERKHADYIKPILCKTITDVDGQVYDLKHTQISVTSFCQKVLQNKSIVDRIMLEKRSNSYQSHVIESPMNSQLAFRTRGFLQLEIYLDETQIAPSGIFNKTQKFLCVYISVANIPYQHRVKNEDISILLLVNRKKLQNLSLKDQFGALFRNIRDEIMVLNNNGLVATDSNENKHTIQVTISTILGDNLGIYQFLGFGCSFQNRSFICRFCSAKGKSRSETDIDIQELFSRKKLIKNPSQEDYAEIGVRSSFALDNVGGINRWNVSPPDAVIFLFTFCLFI